MIEPVKVMMDEQTKVALKQLEGALADLLSPLKKLDEDDGASDGADIQRITGEIRKLSNFLEDALDDIKRKLSDVCDNQAELFRKVAELSAKQVSASVVTVTPPQGASAPDTNTKSSVKKAQVAKKVNLAIKASKTKKPVAKPVSVKSKPEAKKTKPVKVAASKRAPVKPAVKKVKKSR